MPETDFSVGRFEQSQLPLFGDNLEPVDYADPQHWLNLPGSIEVPWTIPDVELPDENLAADVFYAYPTSFHCGTDYPLAQIDNPDMRRVALRHYQEQASAFCTVGRIFAPYYRQLDAAYAATQTPHRAAELFLGQPLTDLTAAFYHYLRHYNEGRPFILLGHSQGAIVLSGMMMTVFNPNSAAPFAAWEGGAALLDRLVAAYLIGSVWSSQAYQAADFLKPATRANDTGVIVAYNTEAPVVDGYSPFMRPQAVTINPISWRTDEEPASATQSKGSLVLNSSGKYRKREQLADARIDLQRGTIICSTVDREKFGSRGPSRAYFPPGVLHESDIPLYYYDLRANAKERTRAWYALAPFPLSHR